ncbi:chemotaxis protein CheA [Fodinibius sp. Rm-B-1B1-1]|uniref:chemotaxis protein CheA n=1 Tax=Fodinibius alkaliphilus TaxID=3140241 RepID=UPI00315B38F5
MSGKKEQRIEDLEKILRALADVWPADRDNVAVAGAQFEEFISTFEDDPGQLQRLIDMSWKGLKYLFEEDAYFMSVKTATMQAINTIREYLVNDGDIEVEVFEKAYDDLADALSGEKESADELIELNEEEEDMDDSKSLNDLASFIMELDEENVAPEEIKSLYGIINAVIDGARSDVAEIVKGAKQKLEKISEEGIEDHSDWLSTVSAITEKAIEAEENEEVEQEEVKTEEVDKGASSESEEDQSESITSEEFYIPEDIDAAMIGEFITECSELLEMAEGALLDLEENPNNDELVNKVFRAFHTIKGTSAFMGLDPISDFTHHLETVLSMVRDGEIDFDVACADISLESIDIIYSMLDVVEVADGGDHLPKPLNFDRLTKVLHRVADEQIAPEKALEEAGGIQYEDPEESMAAPAQNGTAKTNGEAQGDSGSDDNQTESSVRVNVSRLDQLIDMVGELVIAHSVVAQDESIPDHSDLQKKISHTSKILRELQDTSLALRMVPLKGTFHKMNRLVRDLSRKAGKKVKLSTYGEDTEIDRNMVDVINEPLVHMVRNAIDHGIETPEERLEAGKSEQAHVWLRASQEGGKVVIEIEDDGRGINKEKVLEKAISKGLVDPDENLTDNEIHHLIFLPGFSSTDEVTDLSGRGVGMDVVRKSIEDLKGKVDIESVEGKGTKIIIELPFTLAITDGMLVRVGTQRFIVPILNIDRAFRAQRDDLFTVMGKSEKVSIRGETVPVIRLHDHFNIDDGKEDLTEGTLLAIRNANKKYALLVDEVVGQQQLVGKSINMVAEMDHISGGAVLGDGTVGLILDTAALIKN